MSRPRKAVLAVHRQAVDMWEACDRSMTHIGFIDIEARLFGMGEVLRAIGESQASADAFFLASLAGHLSRGDLAEKIQGGGLFGE